MPAMRCSTCGIDYPAKRRDPCVICDGPLWYAENIAESETWQWEATRLLQIQEEKAESREQPYWLTVLIQRDAEGRLYLDRYEAYRARGNTVLALGDVVEMPDTELAGRTRLYEVIGNDRDRGRYYIRAVGELPGPRREVTISRPSGTEVTGHLVLYDPELWDGD